MRVDAGVCAPYQIEAKNSAGLPTMHFGPSLGYALLPEKSEVIAFSGICSGPAKYVQGPIIQDGALRMEKFGETTVYPTILPSIGTSQGRAVTVRSIATLFGFPTQLRYGVCTPIKLTASAIAFEDTLLSLSTNGSFYFGGGTSCSGPTLVPTIYGGSDTFTGVVRTTTGGKVTVFSSPSVLEHETVLVELLRPDGGFPCAGPGAACLVKSTCCSDICGMLSACQ